jgi:hypothetical protein
VRPWCRASASGRTAHCGSSSAASEYSCSRRASVFGEEYSPAGATTSTRGSALAGLACTPRYRIRSPSVVSGSSVYSERSVTTRSASCSAQCSGAATPPSEWPDWPRPSASADQAAQARAPCISTLGTQASSGECGGGNPEPRRRLRPVIRPNEAGLPAAHRRVVIDDQHHAASVIPRAHHRNRPHP